MTLTNPLLSEDQDRLVAASIELGMQQIQREIAAGRIPPTITEFSALHDYVDANEFGGLCDEDGQWRRLFPRETATDEELFCEAANRVQDALTKWLANSAERNALLVTNLIDDALNAACLAVQTRLKLDYGDVAGVFFSGEQKTVFEEMFARYALCEIAMMSKDESA
ncbi:hypothetical protein PO002_34220 [Cupriavidus necator]|uniref:hypothetical protein n=1 Tax=Cupriavidus necator TaxID=106590 RepID=UPI0039C0B02C